MQGPQEKVPEVKTKKDEVEEITLGTPSDTEDTNLAQQASVLLEQESNKKKVALQSEQSEALMQAFLERFKDNDWYKKTENQPLQNDDGSITMHFESLDDLADFSQSQAAAGRDFVMIDEKTNQVMAYSKGDGKLYNGDGSEYDPAQKGQFKMGKDYKDFVMPKQGAETVEKVTPEAPDETPEEDTAPTLGH